MPDGRDPDPDSSATTLVLGSLACDPDALPPARRKPTTVARLRLQMLRYRSWAVHGGPTLVAREPDPSERLAVPSAHLAPLPPPYALPLPMSESARAWDDAERARVGEERKQATLDALAATRAACDRLAARKMSEREAAGEESDDGEGRAFTLATMGRGGWGR